MVKSRNLIAFMLNYIFKNKLIMFYVLFSFISFVLVHFIITKFLKQTSEVETWYKFSYIIYLVSISLIITLIIILTHIIFASIKNNGIHLHLNVTSLSRRKIFVIQTLVLMSLSILFIALFSVALFAISYIQKQKLFARYYAFNIIVFVLMSSILSPFIIAFNLFLKGIIAIVLSILTSVSIPATYIGSRLISSSTAHDNLSYRKDINYNNYALAYEVNDQGTIVNNHLINMVEYANESKNNNFKEIYNSINPLKNDSVRKFMIGDLLSQLSFDLLSLTKIPSLTNKQLYKMSKGNYFFNTSVVKLEDYKSGEPNEISDKNNIVLVAYGDQNPFQMTYSEIFDGIDSIIQKNDLANKKLLMRSITTKTHNLNSWSEIKFAKEEKKILDAFSGVKDNHWLFYLLKYKNLLNNKISKLYADVGRKRNPEVQEFINFLFKDNTFANNVTNFKTIVSTKEINKQFPSIGILSSKNNANQIDITYFKKDLVHFANSANKPFPKILTQNGTYEKIDVNQIKDFVNNYQISNFASIADAFKNQENWDQFIDQNTEVANLKKIYEVFYSLNSRIKPEYVFQNNADNIYEINKVIKVSQDKWIHNSIIILALMWFVSMILLFVTYQFYRKWGGVYV